MRLRRQSCRPLVLARCKSFPLVCSIFSLSRCTPVAWTWLSTASQKTLRIPEPVQRGDGCQIFCLNEANYQCTHETCFWGFWGWYPRKLLPPADWDETLWCRCSGSASLAWAAVGYLDFSQLYVNWQNCEFGDWRELHCAHIGLMCTHRMTLKLLFNTLARNHLFPHF